MTKRRPNRRRSTRSRNAATSSAVLRWFQEVDRVRLLMIGFGILVALIVFRLFSIQILQHDKYTEAASRAHGVVQQLEPSRGEIYAQDKYSETGVSVIATNQTSHQVYVNPRQVTDANAIADNVSTILAMDPEVVRERASKENDVYEPLTTASEQQIEALEQAIEEYGLNGVHWLPEENRFYPEGESVAAVTGFVGIVDDKRTGQYGIEGYFNEELSGVAGELNRQQDAFGRFITVGDSSVQREQDGETIITTIDKNIQYKACESLANAVEKHDAERGTVIVMNPETGAILAMCDAPLYDPNNYSDVENINVFQNDAVTKSYEIGSVMKTIALAAAINEGAISPYTPYTDTGEVKIGSFTIRNSDGEAHGPVDMTYVLEASLNTGCIWALEQIGDAKWYDYMQAFGFGERTGIRISGENAGDISSVSQLKDIYTATSCYGQGMLATPLQMIQSYAAIANDGVMMKPYIIDRIVKSNGYEEVTEPTAAGQPISAETARTVSAMLVRVVESGHAAKAAVDGYHTAGKTGTAQIANPDGPGYLEFAHNDTFVGFVSVSDPQAVILANIDEPKDVMWSSASAAPLFSDIAQFTANYMQIEPDRSE